MRARFLIGDVYARLAETPDHSVDFLLCSPPFLALRSYLPAGHPDKAHEIGSEATPAEFLDTLLALTAEWGRVLAPHGSIAIELGDTYSGSGGAGWPLDKGLCFIPQLYGACLAYGRNLLTGQPSPAGMWRVRTVKPWIRSNPPVGALGDKERPATSYVIVATRARDRWFDLDAVRTAPLPHTLRYDRSGDQYSNDGYNVDQRGDGGRITSNGGNAAGAPPRDWWHHVDAVLDAELARRAGRPTANRRNARGVTSRPNTTKAGHDDRTGGNRSTLAIADPDQVTTGAQGVHLRRALERAGILTTLEAVDVSPKGYSGAHYAVWPAELVRLLVEEMCPRRVCTICGQPSRRITEVDYEAHGDPAIQNAEHKAQADYVGQQRQQNAQGMTHGRATKHVATLGWSDCGHDTWRPGLVLDPFVGSGTTLAVATGMGRDAIGIDLDQRNAILALERCGPLFLDIDWPPPNWQLPTLSPGRTAAAYEPWAHLIDITDPHAAGNVLNLLASWCQPAERPELVGGRRPNEPQAVPEGQTEMFT